MKKRLKLYGFTLAEILIALGIIGIVAAITIPTLMNNYQKKQHVSGLKKTYTQVSQIINQIAIDYGSIGNLVGTGLFEYNLDARNIFGDEFVKYVKIAKNCRTDTSGCFSRKVYDYYDGQPNTSFSNRDIASSYRFITIDGVSISLASYANTVSGADCLYGSGSGVTNVCASLTVDVNGPKGPNYMGRDVFLFDIVNKNGIFVYPYGGAISTGYWDGTTKTCNSSDKKGFTCSARIMEEGWEMNY